MMAGEMLKLEEMRKKHTIEVFQEYCRMDFQEEYFQRSTMWTNGVYL